ncbi:hypothetical protein FHG87_016766 [Trinorchestia longiramus]|nr:hypothetical protein FHG87_016766 [Trinorchestia longiramus]
MCLETNNNVRFKPSDRLRQCSHYDRWRLTECGVLGSGVTLTCCGVMRLPADILMKAYRAHRPLIDPLLAPLLSPASTLQELRGVAHELSIESCTSTRSRTCTPLALLQLDAAPPPHPAVPTQSKFSVGCGSPHKILLHFYEDELYEFHKKLEEVQKKLDSFQ